MDVVRNRRLEFEPEAIDDMLGRRQRSDAKGLGIWRVLRTLLVATLAAGTVGGGAWAAVYAYKSGLFSSDKPAINTMSVTLLRAMVNNKMDDALTVFPEGPESSQLLFEEEKRVFRPEVARTVKAGPDAITERVSALTQLREDLSAQGVNWTDVTPLAFGGVRGSVLDQVRMQQPATAIVGDIYFKSAGKVFLIELTAWRCKKSYVVLDLWQSKTVAMNSESLADDAKKRYKDFEREQPEAGEAHLDKLKSLFFQF